MEKPVDTRHVKKTTTGLSMIRRGLFFEYNEVDIGFESMDHRTLRLMNKGQSPADIREAVSAFNRFDIPVHGMFVLGFDSDTPETLEGTLSFARRSGISAVQFLILTPLPGTGTYDKLHAQGRIIFDDWSLYDGHHVTFKPTGISPLALQRAQIRGHREFYSVRRLVNKAMGSSLEHAAVYAYAQKLNFAWKRKNRLYLKALRLISESRGVITGVNFHHPAAQVTGF